MIEPAPQIHISPEKLYSTLSDSEKMKTIADLQNKYVYWTDIKYSRFESFDSPKELWSVIKWLRIANSIQIHNKFGLHTTITPLMQRLCHYFDMQFGGAWGNDSIIPHDNRQRYLISSVIDEAISSSQMEGAATTRKVAKDMLKKKLRPRNKSEQMIFNNFQTISYLSEHKNLPLSRDLILNVHSLMTLDTMENSDIGCFRANNEVVVENGITHEVVHTPPDFSEIDEAIEWLCEFANSESSINFLHPIIKGIIIHFFISYIHPFADGNGRTARALFYWYMLKNGYWLTEYLSISRVIQHSKKRYEKVFLQVERDGNDLGYFITYHLHALETSFKNLQDYIELKQSEQTHAKRLLRLGNISLRQAEILNIFVASTETVLTIKDISSNLRISQTTAKHDILGLINEGYLDEININLRKKAYIKSGRFDELINI